MPARIAMSPEGLSRRNFLAGAIVLPLALQDIAAAMSVAPAARWVYFGTGTAAGIYRSAWNAATGTLSEPTLAAASDHPTYLALHPTLPLLYAANEAGPNSAASSFHVDKATGELTSATVAPTHRDGPCYLSVAPSGDAVLTANYSSGSLSFFAAQPNGSLFPISTASLADAIAHGPVADRQDASHLHCATFFPGGRTIAVCDLGTDTIFTLPFRPAPPIDRSGYVLHMRLPTLGHATAVRARSGSGPRHVAFHPNGRWMYCIHELDCTLDLFDVDAQDGLRFREGSVVSTLSAGASLSSTKASLQGNTACELQFNANGSLLYTCTRGVNEIAVYRVHPQTGLLTEVQRLACGGQTPRYITLDPSRRWLLCCNQASSNVTVFGLDAGSGLLHPTPRSLAVNTPMFALFV
jgi:6-phosphogluconolactonase